jgi:hypothetical protein
MHYIQKKILSSMAIPDGSDKNIIGTGLMNH